MNNFIIDDKTQLNDFLEFIQENNLKLTKEGNKFYNKNMSFLVNQEFIGELYETIKYNIIDIDDDSDSHIIEYKKESDETDLIYGKDGMQGITNAEVVGGKLLLFKNTGEVIEKPAIYWLLSNIQLTSDWVKLEGNLHYQYIRTFNNERDLFVAKNYMKKNNIDFYEVYNKVESSMIYNGYTLFKGLHIKDVSVLSFDIETTNIPKNNLSKVLMISNTFRKNDEIVKKLFTIDQYEKESEMIKAWCEWVTEKINPEILLGHNVISFDLPYLNYCYKRETGENLPLGRYKKEIKIEKYDRKFRVDGNRDMSYNDISVFGRQIIDTMFLALRFDIGKKYETYGLKQIIMQEGMEKENRIKWDFDKYPGKRVYDEFLAGDLEAVKRWEKFKDYTNDDADDSLKLYDLMIPSYFYYMQHIPMDFQTLNQTATGRQINGFLIRAYLQKGHSIPKKSESKKFRGGISYGNPGIYDHVKKLDIKSMYPSIIISEQIYDKDKDPEGRFLQMVTYFTKQRIANKKLAKETGKRYYKDIEQAQKIFINSAYGLLGTKGMNFNSFDNADKVTSTGREILQKGVEWACGYKLKLIPKLLKSGEVEKNKDGSIKMEWAKGDMVTNSKKLTLVNVDTDSFSYATNRELTDEEYLEHQKELNGLFSKHIEWEDDGYFRKVIVLKAKNYILYYKNDKNKMEVIFKGSSLKDQKKEKRLTNFQNDVIILLLKNKKDHIFDLYHKYIKEIQNIKDISDWCKKITVSKKLIESERTNETALMEAIKDTDYQEGDKKWIFVEDIIDKKNKWRAKENFDGKYSKIAYMGKLYKTLCTFETIIDVSCYPNYKLSKNQGLLNDYLGNT